MKQNQDSVVPTTPKAMTPKTPNMRYSQKREKRVLFAGIAKRLQNHFLLFQGPLIFNDGFQVDLASIATLML